MRCSTAQHASHHCLGIVKGRMNTVQPKKIIINFLWNFFRHEIYKSQYRAMFTFNCTVDKSTIMKFPFQSKKGNKTRSEQPASEECRPEEDEKYHPVRCSVCDTQVGVFDKDEVFHFFNVVTSHWIIYGIILQVLAWNVTRISRCEWDAYAMKWKM